MTKLFWFVGFVKSCQEKRVAQALDALGIENYLPIQKEKRKWSDRIKVVEKRVIPGLIFVHTDKNTRVDTLGAIYGLYAYMNNHGPYDPVIVPDRQMDDFRRMVESGDRNVTVMTSNLAPGDLVRVIDGPLEGMECELVTINGKKYVSVRLGMLGSATVELMADKIEKINQTKQYE